MSACLVLWALAENGRQNLSLSIHDHSFRAPRPAEPAAFKSFACRFKTFFHVSLPQVTGPTDAYLWIDQPCTVASSPPNLRMLSTWPTLCCQCQPVNWILQCHQSSIRQNSDWISLYQRIILDIGYQIYLWGHKEQYISTGHFLKSEWHWAWLMARPKSCYKLFWQCVPICAENFPKIGLWAGNYLICLNFVLKCLICAKSWPPENDALKYLRTMCTVASSFGTNSRQSLKILAFFSQWND